MDEAYAMQLEWTVREYEVVSTHLMELLAEAEETQVPASVKGALVLLARAIEAEWNDDPREENNG